MWNTQHEWEISVGNQTPDFVKHSLGNIINMAYTDLKSCPLIRIKKWGKGKDVIVHISNKHIDITTYMHIITHRE